MLLSVEGWPLVVPACDCPVWGTAWDSRVPLGMELNPWKNQLELGKFHILDQNDLGFFTLSTAY